MHVRLLFSLFGLVTAVFYGSNSFAQLSQQGPNHPSTVTEQAFGCLACPGTTWVNHMNASFPDIQYASTQMTTYGNCFQTSCYYARALEAENFSFTIPSNAQVTGVVAEVLKMASAMNAVQDTLVQLLLNGLPIGNSRADTAYWNLSPGYTLYGDSTDLWGTSLLPSDVNSPTFGLFFKPINKNMISTFTTASVDAVRIIVYYQVVSGVPEYPGSEKFPSIYLSANQQELIIQSESTGGRVEINLTNLLGMRVFSLESQDPVLSIRTNEFSNGLYLVSVKSGSQVYRKKVLLAGR